MYEGPRLAALFDREEEEILDALAFDMAQDGGEMLTRNIQELTPVGHRPFDGWYVPGHLKRSIEQTIVVVTPTMGGTLFETATETNVTYAVFVEHGTGLWGPRRARYEIRPKNPDGWLRFHDKHGNLVFAKRVMHPGSPGAHMFSRGIAVTEPEFHAMIDRKLAIWARAGEARWDRKGRTDRIAS